MMPAMGNLSHQLRGTCCVGGLLAMAAWGA